MYKHTKHAVFKSLLLNIIIVRLLLNLPGRWEGREWQPGADTGVPLCWQPFNKQWKLHGSVQPGSNNHGESFKSFPLCHSQGELLTRRKEERCRASFPLVRLSSAPLFSHARHEFFFFVCFFFDRKGKKKKVLQCKVILSRRIPSEKRESNPRRKYRRVNSSQSF